MPFHKVNSKLLIVNRVGKSSIYHLPFSIHSKVKRAFTLIEFLVVLGILSITVSATLLFLTSVLRGSNKANIIAEVKQNGQVVLESLERQIRNGVDAQQIGQVENNTIKIIRQDQDPLYIKCIPNVSLNGYIGTVVSTTDPSDLQYISMTNKEDTISGVDIACSPLYDITCGFQVLPASTGVVSPAVVSICFYVNQGIQAPSRLDFEAKIKFQTTISLRRY